MMKKLLSFLVMTLTLAITANAQSKYSNVSFQDLDDVFLFIMPSKTFGTGDGELEIRCIEHEGGAELKMYFRGKFLSEVGWEDPNTVAHGKFARLAIRTNNRQVSVILHLPDNSHSRPYLYFEPGTTSTDRNLARALNLPITEGYEKYEPIVDGNRASLSFEPSSKKQQPSIYYMK